MPELPRRDFIALSASLLADFRAPLAQAGPPRWLDSAWQMYMSRFLTSEGRLTDDANGGVSHSEGQGYAMLLATRAEDHAAFDRVWKWTKTNLMVRADGLAAWRHDPRHTPHVADLNNATDGDLLIAWALAEAADRWQETTYLESARRIADAILKYLIVPSPWGPVLMPGAKGFGPSEREDGPIINLAYWVFPAIDRLKSLRRGASWDGIGESGLALIDRARFGPARLPSNWISLAGGTLAPAKGFASVFGYDAVRIPLYLGWARPRDKERLAIFAASFGAEPAVINISDGRPTEPLRGQGFAAIGALVRNLADGAKIPQSLLKVEPEFYYPTTLHILSLIAALDATHQ
jgi:endoglucanase